MMRIDLSLEAGQLAEKIARMWQLSGRKVLAIDAACQSGSGTPVFTVRGKYTAQGWTEWTQGFQFGWALLQFDATGETRFLDIGRTGTIEKMASHVTHTGVHDHGFNNVSTYGNLLRLMREGRTAFDLREQQLYELALRASGAVQAARFSSTHDGHGYIYSFNGPHSLFCDTIRSLRALALAHQLGHRLMGENDEAISLLDRLIQHARTTAKYSVYYGHGRDIYDVRGRVAHECIFNRNDGRFRCPSTQQGYSPFSTWTRGLSWVMLGYAEQLEWLATINDAELDPYGGRADIEAMMLAAARTACDYYIENTPTDGIPYWDTGAPGLAALGDYLDRAADPFNPHEPVDSSAAAIGAQGLLRLGRYLQERGDAKNGGHYWQAGLGILDTLLEEPYLSTAEGHQGLLLHTVYHRPNGWDHIPEGSTVPRGESCLWGDYHLAELALTVQRQLTDAPYYTFFGPTS